MVLPELEFDGLQTQQERPWGDIDKTLEAYGDVESAYSAHLFSMDPLSDDLDFEDLKLPVVTPEGDLHEGALDNAAARLSQTDGIPSDEMSALEEKIDNLQSRFEDDEEEMSVDRYVNNPLLVAELDDHQIMILRDLLEVREEESNTLKEVVDMDIDRREIELDEEPEEEPEEEAEDDGEEPEEEMSDAEDSESSKTVTSVEELDELLDILWSS